MIRTKKYLRFWIWIDLVGIALSVILIISYLLWGDRFSDHVQNLLSNLAIEVFGVWMSVRIIDYLLQRHRQFRDTRFHQLRIFQYFFDVATNIWQYNADYERDIDKLKIEVKYFDKRWPKRQSKFYKDERQQIMALRQVMPKIVEVSNNMLQANQEVSTFFNRKYEDRTESQEAILKLRQTEIRNELKTLLSEYLEKLELLRENVWDETHPDD